MIYFTVLRVENFKPKSPEETPADGVILKAIPLIGVIPVIVREFNHLVLKSGFMPHIWAVLYLSPKQPEIGEKANPEKFLTLKDVEELCKWGEGHPHKLER